MDERAIKSEDVALRTVRFVHNKYFLFLAAFIFLNVILISLFLQPYTTPFASDSEQYMETAKHFRGVEAEIYPWRLLKPLIPFLTALGSFAFGWQAAFLLINAIFFFFIGLLVFKIIELLFGDSPQALIGALLFVSAYPMLEYGVAYMTDVAGWFFFVWTVYLTLLFLRKPSYVLAAAIGLVSLLGILSKESGGMGALFFAICLFFVFKDNFVNKLKYFCSFCLAFLPLFFSWQAFVYLKFHYSYYDWLFSWNISGSEAYQKEAVRLVLKSLGATFLFGGFLFY